MKKGYQISEEELKLIERFLHQQMTQEEDAAFRMRLATDAEWKEKTEELRLLVVGIREAALEEKLNQFHKNVTGTSTTGTSSGLVFRLPKQWLVAASVFIIAGLSVWWFVGRQTRYEKLYAAYFEPDPGLMTAMGTSDKYNFTKAMVEYREGNYENAVEAWEQLRKIQPQSDTLAYFLGVAYLAMNKETEATALLVPIANDSKKPFFKDACWYIGLVFLKKGEAEKGVEYIRQSGYSKSTKLINEIKQ